MSRIQQLTPMGDGFTFDPATGDTYVLNATAAELLRGVQEGLDEGQLAERVVARFGVDPGQAAEDVDDFLMQLRALRML